MKAIELTFRLAFATRRDEEADVYVGYCPLLNLYSQGMTEQEAQDAVVDASQLFLVTCYERDTLHRVLRNRGMKRAAAAPRLESANHQFIAIKEFEGFDNPFERDVPIDLLVANALETSSLCQ